ncbi:class I SAM-dependent DNA methyltransferase [Salidesulfovibrio brasiliensis]|uniref:class I SAM-dependent DNA methyltransferase n=1 Tax=Salidesulfovibrio brasiliensis TaxID=221711 RepID=UPI0006D2A175|nr:methyltransferase domain-containing protein [Salidesulfovibrio brasiliensis]
MKISKQEVLDKVYTADNHKDLMDAYKLWAKDYDGDTVDKFGYVAPMVSAQTLNKFMPETEVRILDAGCGTGLVGQILQDMGYKKMDALDYSKEMLDIAEEKGVYDACFHADLSKPLEMKDNAYDAVICVGTFTYGHVGPQAFDELIRITKPGGHICFTIRDGAFEDYDFREHMIDLEQKERWELLEMSDQPYLAKEDVNCKLCTYAVS